MMISRRTKESLRAAKARGVKLGSSLISSALISYVSFIPSIRQPAIAVPKGGVMYFRILVPLGGFPFLCPAESAADRYSFRKAPARHSVPWEFPGSHFGS